MKEIQLTKGQVVIVDDEDYERINQHKWYALKVEGNKFYAARDMWLGNNKKKTILMHRIIMNVPKDLQADHINGCALDNCRQNLRLATNQQNNMNKIYPMKNNKLGIKGIHWDKKNKKFIVQVQYVFVGRFFCLEKAKSEHRKAELKYQGEFARKIFPEQILN